MCHTLSLLYAHTHAHGGADGWRDKGAEGQRGRGTAGQRGGGAEGMGGGGAEGLGGGGLEWDNVGYVHQLHLGTPMLISWVMR